MVPMFEKFVLRSTLTSPFGRKVRIAASALGLSERIMLVRARGLVRYQALTRATLADGITDAALLIVYEARFRDGGASAQAWLDHQRGKVERGLAAFEAAPRDPNITDVVSIGLACALAYLDWRRPLAWRDGHPGLVAWLAAFEAHEPAAVLTHPTFLEPADA